MRIDPAVYRQWADALREEFGEDDALVADMLEGETDLHEVIGRLLEAEAEADAFAAACKALAARYAERAAQQAARQEATRGALERLMRAVGLPKIQHAAATISFRTVPAGVRFDGAVEDLPDDLVRTIRKPDAAAIKAAVASGRNVPGAFTTPPSTALAIRRK